MNRIPIINIQRVPVIGIERVPIIGVSNDTTEELSWDKIYEQLVNYIKYASKQVAEQYETGSVNSAEDLFQEGQLLLYHCYTIYKNKNMNEFSALFKASLWRKLREIGKKKSFIQVDIDGAYDLGYSDDVVDELYQEYKLQQIASLLESEPIALTIVKEFINPSSRTIWEAEMDLNRKQSLKDQNFSVAVPKSIQIRGVHIQRALEIPKVRFNESFKLVKSVVSSVYGRTENEVEGLLQNCV